MLAVIESIIYCRSQTFVLILKLLVVNIYSFSQIYADE